MEARNPRDSEEFTQQLQEEAKRNSQARNSLVLGVTSLTLTLFNSVPGLLSALGFVGAVAALFAFLAGVKGLRATREPDAQGRKLAIAGIAAGALGLILFIVVMASSVLGMQRYASQLLEGTISPERAQRLATDIVEEAGATVEGQRFFPGEGGTNWLVSYNSQHLSRSELSKQQEQIILALSEILIEIEPPVYMLGVNADDANDKRHDLERLAKPAVVV